MEHQLLLSPMSRAFSKLHQAYPRSSSVRSETSNRCLSSHRRGTVTGTTSRSWPRGTICSGKRLTRVTCSKGKPLTSAGRGYRVSADRHCRRRQRRAGAGSCTSSNLAADSRLCEVSIFLVYQCDRRSFRVQSGRPERPSLCRVEQRRCNREESDDGVRFEAAAVRSCTGAIYSGAMYTPPAHLSRAHRRSDHRTVERIWWGAMLCHTWK